jgi:hypothetical protein
MNLFYRPTDDGTKMEAPGVLVNAALDYGVTHVNILRILNLVLNNSFLGSLWKRYFVCVGIR